MGNLAGHVVPGVFFIIYGLSWIILSFWYHLTTTSSNSSTSRSRSGSNASSSSYTEFKRQATLARLSYIPQPFCSRVPIEPLLKILFPVLGIISETLFDVKNERIFFSVLKIYHSDGTLVNPTKLHHITMYSAFAISGIVDLINLVIRIPRNTTKVFLGLAFIIEGLLFWFHTNHTELLDVAVHSLLLVTIFAAAILIFLRIFQPSNVLINSFLGIVILTQGTWFVNGGVVLYTTDSSSIWNKNTDNHIEEHYKVSLVVVIFTWHVISWTFLVLLFYITMLACVKSSTKYRKHMSNTSKVTWPLSLHKDRHFVDEEQNNLITKGNDNKDSVL